WVDERLRFRSPFNEATGEMSDTTVMARPNAFRFGNASAGSDESGADETLSDSSERCLAIGERSSMRVALAVRVLRLDSDARGERSEMPAPSSVTRSSCSKEATNDRFAV